MVFAPASALHSAANVSVARNSKRNIKYCRATSTAAPPFCAPPARPAGSYLITLASANAPAKHQGLTAVWWCLRHACFYSRKIFKRKQRGSRPHRPGWHGAGMALLASSVHRFALHSRGSARQELPERKQRRLYSCRSRPITRKVEGNNGRL
jgi:hypothetical protein